MAWIYLAESEDSPWLYRHGSDRSPTVREIDSHRLYFCHGCGTDQLQPLQFGTTFPPYPQRCCPEGLTSSMEDSPARILALQEMELAWMESEADYFSRSVDSLAIFDRDSFSWRTSQLSLFGGLTEFLWSSLSYGMTVDGLLYQPQKLEPVTCVKDGGYLDTPTVSTASYRNQNIPTPAASNYGRNKSNSEGSAIRLSLHGMATRGVLPGHPKGSLNPEWVELAMGYRIGWSEIGDLEMQWFRSKRGKHSLDLSGLKDGNND